MCWSESEWWVSCCGQLLCGILCRLQVEEKEIHALKWKKNPKDLSPFVQKINRSFLPDLLFYLHVAWMCLRIFWIFFSSVSHFTITVTACFCQREKTLSLYYIHQCWDLGLFYSEGNATLVDEIYIILAMLDTKLWVGRRGVRRYYYTVKDGASRCSPQIRLYFVILTG